MLFFCYFFCFYFVFPLTVLWFSVKMTVEYYKILFFVEIKSEVQL